MESNFRFDLQLFADDEDELLDDDELRGILDEDPDLAFDPDLEDDEDDEDDELDDEIEDEDKPRKKPKKQRAEVSPIDDDTRRILDDIRANPDRYKRQDEPKVVVQPQRQPEPEQTFNLDAAAEEFSKDLLTDPKKAAMKFLSTAVQLSKTSEQRIRRDVEAEYSNTRVQSVTSNVRDVMREFDEHPAMNAEVKKEFKTLVDTAVKNSARQIANMSNDDIRKGLEASLAEAVGRVAMANAGKKPRQSSTAPRYSSRGSGNARPGRPAPKISEDERDVVRNMRSAGISAKDIKAAIRELRAEAS